MDGAEISVTFSCGIADIAHYESATDLNAAADEALYAAKENGRDQVRLAD
jgi:PleD family two-component response regulator